MINCTNRLVKRPGETSLSSGILRKGKLLKLTLKENFKEYRIRKSTLRIIYAKDVDETKIS